MEVNEPEPHQDQDTTPNVAEVCQKKKEPYKSLLPFPSRLRGTNPKAEEANQEILETFRNVEINIPLLNAIM